MSIVAVVHVNCQMYVCVCVCERERKREKERERERERQRLRETEIERENMQEPITQQGQTVLRDSLVCESKTWHEGESWQS